MGLGDALNFLKAAVGVTLPDLSDEQISKIVGAAVRVIRRPPRGNLRAPHGPRPRSSRDDTTAQSTHSADVSDSHMLRVDLASDSQPGIMVVDETDGDAAAEAALAAASSGLESSMDHPSPTSRAAVVAAKEYFGEQGLKQSLTLKNTEAISISAQGIQDNEGPATFLPLGQSTSTIEEMTEQTVTDSKDKKLKHRPANIAVAAPATANGASVIDEEPDDSPYLYLTSWEEHQDEVLGLEFTAPLGVLGRGLAAQNRRRLTLAQFSDLVLAQPSLRIHFRDAGSSNLESPRG